MTRSAVARTILWAMAFGTQVCWLSAASPPLAPSAESENQYLASISEEVERSRTMLEERLSGALEAQSSKLIGSSPENVAALRHALDQIDRFELSVDYWRSRRSREPYRSNFMRFLRITLGSVLDLRGALGEEVSASQMPKVSKPAAGKSPSASSGTDPPPMNDDCESATPIGDGTYSGSTASASQDGDSACGYSSPDVWFWYFAYPGEWIFDTFGSDFDTVLSLHQACPGTAANEIACSDDSSGTLQSRVVLDLNGEWVRVRVAGYDGDTGHFQLNVGPRSSITGTVTDVSGAPLEAAIRVYDHEGRRLRDTSTYHQDGSFFVQGLMPGTYYVRSTSYNFLGQLWSGVPCVGECDPTAGDPILLSYGDEAVADFVMQDGGVIQGVVTEDGSGGAIETAVVRIYDSLGSHVRAVYTDRDGHYELRGLGSGAYFAKADGSEHVSELWDDIVCPDSCNITSGKKILVEIGETDQVDFALRRGGSIAGVITDNSTGVPLESARVELTRENSGSTRSAYSNQDGTYVVSGLNPDTYFIQISASDYVRELYDDFQCPSYCDPSTGTPVVVDFETLATANAALDRAGSISGTIVEDLTGRPLSFKRVEVYNSTGSQLDSDRTDDLGRYRVDRLPATGSYYVVARGGLHIDEVYDDLPCSGGCDPTMGTPISVTLGEETPGVDFALTFGGGISGSVTESVASLPVFVGVNVWNADGRLQDVVTTGPLGGYEVAGLSAGSYFLSTENYQGYLDELYDDFPCPGGCEPTDGTPVGVSLSVNTSGIDFVLDLGGSISGTLTDIKTGGPLTAWVDVFDSSGDEVADDYGSDGVYAVRGLPTGTYFVKARPPFGFHDELFDDLPCDPCDPTTGTPLSVNAGATTAADFAFCGRPTLIAHFPPDPHPDSALDGCLVQIGGEAKPYHPGCPAIGRVNWCWDDGTCNDQVFPAEHVYTPNGGLVSIEARAWDEWGGLTFAGSEVNLWNCLAAGACGHPESRALSNLTFDSATTVEACVDISVGPDFALVPPGSLLLRAGEKIEFRDGVEIEAGCELTVEVDPELLP